MGNQIERIERNSNVVCEMLNKNATRFYTVSELDKLTNISPEDIYMAFIASVSKHAPHVFDHFHVVKLMNEAIDDIRRAAYAQEKDLNKRKVLKGTRWLLLCNGSDIYDQKFKSRLDSALEMNKPLAQAYYLKESLKEIWQQVTKEQAGVVLEE